MNTSLGSQTRSSILSITVLVCVLFQYRTFMLAICSIRVQVTLAVHLFHWGTGHQCCPLLFQKCDGLMQPEYKKFSIDPQITSFEMLQGILAKAFDIKRYVIFL